MNPAATHYDNAEVTLNLPLTEGCEGSELFFKEGSTTRVVPMEIGTTKNASYDGLMICLSGPI
jgi:hypothetical protein